MNAFRLGGEYFDRNGIVYSRREEIDRYVEGHCGLLDEMAMVFVHGDYHVGNLMLEDRGGVDGH